VDIKNSRPIGLKSERGSELRKIFMAIRSIIVLRGHYSECQNFIQMNPIANSI
jgi:hypothetical protein